MPKTTYDEKTKIFPTIKTFEFIVVMYMENCLTNKVISRFKDNI